MSEFGFLNFIKTHESEILDVIENCAHCIPPVMCEPDHRFSLSDFFLNILERKFSFGGEGAALSIQRSKGFDMLYGRIVRVSVKIQRRVFQKSKAFGGGLTLPSPLVMINTLNKSQISSFSNFDYLLSIQRGEENQNGKTSIGFGVIDSKKLSSLIYPSSSDQIRVRVFNNEYDTLSMRDITLLSDKNKDGALNNVFFHHKSETYRELYKLGVNHVAHVNQPAKHLPNQNLNCHNSFGVTIHNLDD